MHTHGVGLHAKTDSEHGRGRRTGDGPSARPGRCHDGRRLPRRCDRRMQRGLSQHGRETHRDPRVVLPDPRRVVPVLIQRSTAGRAAGAGGAGPPRRTRAAMLNLLAAKAEVVFGLQLVTRHRAPRLAALLGLGVAALAAVSAPSPERTARVVLLVGGTLAAVAAPRLPSPGPPPP